MDEPPGRLNALGRRIPSPTRAKQSLRLPSITSRDSYRSNCRDRYCCSRNSIPGKEKCGEDETPHGIRTDNVARRGTWSSTNHALAFYQNWDDRQIDLPTRSFFSLTADRRSSNAQSCQRRQQNEQNGCRDEDTCVVACV